MAQKGDWFSEQSQETGKWEEGGHGQNTRNKECKPPPNPDIPHGMRTQFQSNARLERTETEGLALLAALGVTVSPRLLKFGRVFQPISKTLPQLFVSCPGEGNFIFSCESQVYREIPHTNS